MKSPEFPSLLTTNNVLSVVEITIGGQLKAVATRPAVELRLLQIYFNTLWSGGRHGLFAFVALSRMLKDRLRPQDMPAAREHVVALHVHFFGVFLHVDHAQVFAAAQV